MAPLDLIDFAHGYTYPRPPVPRRPGRMREIEQAILRELERLDGRATTVRFLFYRLVAEHVLPKALPGRKQPAQYVSQVATELREAGVVPLDAIVDDGRGIDWNPAFATIREGVEAYARTIRLDPWQGEAPVPFLIVESRSLARVLDRATAEYRVPIAALGGQASLSLAYEVGLALPQSVRVLYLGDWDFAGGSIESSIRERALAYSGFAGTGTWERLALTQEQVERLGLPVIQKYDARTRSHHPAVETEALGQDAIERMVREALDESLVAHRVTLDGLRAEEQRQRAQLLGLEEAS